MTAGEDQAQPVIGHGLLLRRLDVPHGERVLDRFLGGVDIAEEADQGGHAATVVAPEDSLDSHGARAYARCASTVTSPLTR
jgi:hypothetical protein